MSHPDVITPAVLWRARPRRRHLEVALDDLRARLAGYCNALANDGNLERRQGGYRHWRCNRRRGHTGQHRGLNYVWPVPAGSSGYAPIANPDELAAELALDTVDVDPLPVETRGKRSRFHDTYGQQCRHLAWRQRDAARRGFARPTPGQVLGLLRRPGAVIAALGAARRLERDLADAITHGTAYDRHAAELDGEDMLVRARDQVAEHLDRAQVPR